VTLRVGIIGTLLAGLVCGVGGCANETIAPNRFVAPAYVGGNDLAVMGGARSQSSASDQQIIEPTSSSKVLSAVVFERVTGRTAYPEGQLLGK